MTSYWCYDKDSKWKTIERRRYDESNFNDFLEIQDYPTIPHLLVGDELNFIACYEHPEKDEYLFHLVMDEICKVLYSNSLPGMLELLLQLTELMNVFFKTLQVVEELKERDNECLD